MKRARNTDPDTSHYAASRANEFDFRHYCMIFDLLTLHPKGLGARQISALLGLEHSQATRRLPEMERRGLVRVVPDEYRETPSGRKERVWVRVWV
jgi:DNA-binding MarR family transcriptional regulator